MYAYIKGAVEEILPDRAIIDANGVGYELFCSANTLKRLRKGETAKLLVHFHLAQDVMALYGFADDSERSMFRRLISVSRVGPKVALSVLSVLSVSDIAAAILTENPAAFDKVPGIGRKTAARVLLELKEQVGRDEIISAGLPESAGEALPMRAEAVAALVELGYDGASASRAVAAIQNAETIEELLTSALKELGRQKL